MALTNQQLERYSRHIILKGIGGNRLARAEKASCR